MIRVLQFRGVSLTSKIIKAFNWGEYSHSAILTPGGTLIESWSAGGVQEVPLAECRHTKGTVIDIYRPVGQVDHGRIVEWLRGQVGKKYDYAGIVHFLRRGGDDDRERWFCSELVAEAFASQGHPLLNAPSHKVSPTLLGYSPRLAFEKRVLLGGRAGADGIGL